DDIHRSNFRRRWWPDLLWGRSRRSIPADGDLYRSHPARRKACRLASPTGDQIVPSRQFEDRQGAGSRRAADVACPRRHGDRMMGLLAALRRLRAKISRQAGSQDFAAKIYRWGLFRKYATLFVVTICVAMVANGVLGIWFFYQEQRRLLLQIQRQEV